jgi:hypothetical protein
MKPADKHYKFINCRTGYVIYYHSISSERSAEEIRAELQEVRCKVAIQNGLYFESVYWEEIREDAEV